jgi:hypothetical protein
MRPSATLVLVTALPILAACGGESVDDIGFANEAADELESILGECTFLHFDATLPANLDVCAARAATLATERMAPPTCLLTKVSGATADVTLTSCDALLGLDRLDAEVELQCLEPPDTGLRLDATSSSIRIAESRYDFIARAVPTFGGPNASLAVQSQGSGKGSRGVELHRESEYTLTWEGTCLRLDGGSTMDVGSDRRSTTITDYRQCDDACPTGKIEHHAADADVTITLDGTVEPHWTSSRDNDGKIILDCGP